MIYIYNFIFHKPFNICSIRYLFFGLDESTVEIPVSSKFSFIDVQMRLKTGFKESVKSNRSGFKISESDDLIIITDVANIKE